MDEQQATAPSTRPFFVPAGIDFESLSDPVKIAFTALVEPTYQELVMGATSALERSAGTTLTFLLALEVIDQVTLGRSMEVAATPNDAATSAREKTMAGFLRLIGAKQRVENFLLRLSVLRAKNGFFEGSLA